MRFDTALMNRWRYAPILGEGPCGGTNNGGPCAFWDVPRQVKLYHASMIGNGNFCNENTNDLRGRDSMRMAWKLSGYRIILEGGSMTSNPTAGGQMGVTLNWKNVGIAPVYENWDVTYELQNQSNNAVAWTSSSTHRLKLWAPQANATVVNDNYTLPSNLPAGTYRLVLKIKDPLNYRAPFPLAIQGRRADGSYLLRADITIGAGTGIANNAPVANAGSDQTVVLPASSVSLTGRGTDNDGTISTYLWSKISGPVGGNIQNPATATTNITGLNAGTYVFRLTVTDNQGAVGTDDIQIIVSAAPAPSPTNMAPVVNAGPDQRLAAGTVNASFTGTAIDPDQAGGSQVNLIVMMGESNASGIAPNTSATARERAPRASVKILNNANFRFEDLDLDQNNNIDNATPWNESHSWEIGLADAVEAGLLPNPTYMVKAAASGTRIDQWLQNGGGTWWDNMRNKMDQAIAQLRAQNRPYKITVWYSLGLNDAVQGTPAAVWRSRIEQFFRDFRAVYGADIQFYMTRFHEYADAPGDGLGHPYNPTIDAIGAADPLTFVVPTQGASYNPGERFVHFDYLGQKLIASRMVSAMRSNQGSGTGSITSVLWSKISGPNGVAITNPNQLTTTVSGLQNGSYSFLLECADNEGAVGRDTLLLDIGTGGSPPFANAGNDQTVTLPANTVTLNGSGSDPDGSITSFAWTKVSGPAGGNILSPATASTGISGLTQGTYIYRLTVTDNSGSTATDDIQIGVLPAPAPTPANQAPVANAGSDRVIALPANTVTLNGAGTDSDGTISSYSWTKVSGPAGGNIQNPNAANTDITGLNAGTYIYRLTVTDNNGATASDDVQIQVNTSLAPSPSNQAPLVNAGADINITLPVNAATLAGNGSDPDGSVASYSWAKLSGPAGGTILSANTANTNVTGLNAGTYIFRLTVTDNAGAQAFDDIQVTVNAAPSPTGNQLPVANAGGNKSITLPINSVTLAGSGTDPDGTISGYSWSKVSGPAGGNINSSNAATTVINNLNEGVYVYRLTVTDNSGASSSDDIQLVVNAAPVQPNTAPNANAGHDISITLPVNSVTLNGTASNDPDGSIVSYSWRKIQGPAGSSFTSTNIASPAVNGLTRGQYEFELTVTDNRGAASTDRVLVTVIKINQKPVAKLTRDTINVALPVQNAELSAIDSYDPDGLVTNYEWTYKQGPKEPKMLSPQSSKTIIADLVAGTYEFDLVVTDDDGAKDKKAVVVIVKNSSSRRLIPDVSVYPNPATSLVNVKISSDVEGRTSLTFIDMNGRPVMTDIFVKGYGSFTRQVNIGQLPKGAYTILIQVDQTERVIEKLIKF
jgi:hypothetical protein